MSNIEVTRDAPRTIHPPIDTSVKLPPSVAALAARAEAAHKAAYNPEPPVAPDPASVAPQPGAPGVQPAAAPAPAPAPAPIAPAAPSVDTLAQFAPPAAGTPPAPDGEGSWEHKFKSQQGRLASQNQQMRQMQQQMADMGNELLASQQRLEELQRTAAAPRPALLITDKDRTDFGDEFLDAAARAAQDRLLPEVNAARQEAAQTRKELHDIKIGRVYDALSTQVGANWRNINRHPSFVAWLLLPDPISGVMRQTLLDGAMQAANAARVVSIFQGFLAEDAASRPAAPAPQPQPAATPAAVPRQPAVSLEALAAPGRASAAPGSPPAAEKPIYTNADIRTFYDNVRKGAYAGQEALKLAHEQDIFAAQNEGRVRG